MFIFIFNHFRLKIFKGALFEVFKTERAQSVTLDKVREFVNNLHSDAPFGEDELKAAINKMMDDNQIMLADNVVFLI